MSTKNWVWSDNYIYIYIFLLGVGLFLQMHMGGGWLFNLIRKSGIPKRHNGTEKTLLWVTDIGA